jgi:hypothetical protein
MPSRRFLAFSIAVCLAGGLQAQTGQQIDFHEIDNESFSPLTYWTKDRMEKAKPMPLPRFGGENTDTSVASNDCETGMLFLTELSKPPYASAGRLFFRTETEDQFCTAEFTGSNKTLLTAAHCVRNRSGDWYTRFLFVQGYDDDGVKKQGVEVELSLVGTWHKYVTAGLLNTVFDYAFFRTHRFSSRHWLQLGTPNPHPFWIAIGYPENAFGGRRLVQMMGPRKKESPIPGVVLMLGNPMTKGSSGGAWIANASLCPSSCSEVVGVMASQSFRDCAAISPLFNGETRDLMEAVRRRHD